MGQAGDALFALARAIDAPVATTAAGKGVFPEVDPLGAGVMGTFGTPEANVVVGQADVVLAVGTKLAPIDTADESTRPARPDPPDPHPDRRRAAERQLDLSHRPRPGG